MPIRGYQRMTTCRRDTFPRYYEEGSKRIFLNNGFLRRLAVDYVEIQKVFPLYMSEILPNSIRSNILLRLKYLKAYC